MTDLSADYAGLKLKNPLVVAAAGITGNAPLIRRAAEHGAAAVVMKTLFEEEYTRRDPSPCFTLIRRRSGPVRSTTFYSFEQASPWGLEGYASELARARQEVEIPVIASINCVSDEAWVRYARELERAGAAGIELNRSCPYSTVGLGGKDLWTSLAVRTLKLVKARVSIPVWVKLTPQLSDPLQAARELEAAGADGLVMFSRFTGLEIDLETERPIMHGGLAGHGGPWAIHYALRWIAAAAPGAGISIAGSGGVCSGEDVIKYLLAGATTVQICTAIYLEGFGVLEQYLDRLKQYMQDKGYRRLEDFRGKAGQRILPTDAVDRQSRTPALIDPEQCRRCGTCYRCCLHAAVDRDGESYRIGDRCAGCGLCVQLCPRGAITMAGAGCGRRE